MKEMVMLSVEELNEVKEVIYNMAEMLEELLENTEMEVEDACAHCCDNCPLAGICGSKELYWGCGVWEMYMGEDL